MQYQESDKSKSKDPTGVFPSKCLQPFQPGFSHDDFYKEDFQAALQLSEREPAPNQSEVARNRILEKIAGQDLPGQEHFIQHIGFKYQKNCKPNTIHNTYTIVNQFLVYLRDIQRTSLGDLSRSDIEGFFQRQQDRGLKPSSLGTHLGYLYAFIRFLVEEGIVSSELLFRKISIKAQASLRKDINRDDVDVLLSVIEDPRDRAMVILLLRTGMRISELLNIKMSDINLEEQTIRIYESVKTRLGRVAYFSNDAASALYDWLLVRDYWKERLFYGMGRQSISYPAARKVFVKYIGKAGLEDKGYTLHCLRHTFATNLLNAGMPIEVLRDLLGHSNLNQTQHYAKLSDRTREAEFFRAMAIIEGEDKNGLD